MRFKAIVRGVSGCTVEHEFNVEAAGDMEAGVGQAMDLFRKTCDETIFDGNVRIDRID